MKNFTVLMVLFLSIISCTDRTKNETTKIVNKADYNTFLEGLKNDTQPDTLLLDSLKTVVAANPGYVIDGGTIASMYDSEYNKTGHIEALQSSVRFRESVAENSAIKPENAMRTLAQAYIKIHEFNKADSIMKIVTADYISDDSHKVLFDINMELGNYKAARSSLNAIKNPNDFNYLTRAAKWNDYTGNLDNTITLLEHAEELLQSNGSPDEKIWLYSNLGDYYGHHGDIQKSYDSYLKTLELDPYNHYSLKGIAWIAYSNDGNTNEAIRILNILKETHAVPDYDLLLSEMYESNGDDLTASAFKNKYLNEVEDSIYGNMYNLYKVEAWLSMDETYKKRALELAKNEIKNRATPETYGFLALAYLENGDSKKALDIIEKHVKGKTFEPVAALQQAQVYKATGNKDKVEELKEELLTTAYEMGPVTFAQIQKL